MKELGYGSGYRYDHDEEDGVAAQSYLPDSLRGSRWYHPVARGWEAEARRRLDAIRASRARAAGAETTEEKRSKP